MTIRNLITLCNEINKLCESCYNESCENCQAELLIKDIKECLKKNNTIIKVEE